MLFRSYYSFFDTAVNQYMMSCGELNLDDSPIVSLVVETGCQYFGPIAFPDVVHCGLRVAHLGTSSVRYEIGLFGEGSETPAAEGWFVHVFVDRETRRSTTSSIVARSMKRT